MKNFFLALILFIFSASCLFAQEAAPGPVKGDFIVYGMNGDASNLIPALASDSASSTVNSRIYNGLVKIDKDLNLIGDLAESWDISADGLIYTFHLRKNVKWHDGAPFTAKDVMFTYQLMIDPKTPTAYAEGFLQVKKAEILDDYTFKVLYDKPLARALITWAFDMMPAHLLAGQNLEESPLSRQPVGTGPYKMEAWEAGQRIVLKANDDYFAGRPHIDKIVFRIIPDESAQLLELLAGGIDSMGLTPDQYVEKKADPGFTKSFNLFRYPDFGYTYLGFNLKNPLFQDVRVRRALALALDKNELVEGVLLGLGTPANGPFKPDMWASNQNVKPYPYEPDQAKALLAEAGWRDTNGDGILDKDGQPFQFTLMTNQGNSIREQTALIIQARLKKVGIDVKVRVMEWAAFIKNYLDARNFEAVVMGWSIPLDPDLYDVWSSAKAEAPGLNFISYKNDEVDRLIDESRFTHDKAVRKKAYDRIQEIFYEDVPYVFLFVPDALPAVSSRFIGPEVTPAGLDVNFIKWYVPQELQRYKP